MSQVSNAVDRILGVTITHESGGNWGAVNKRTGAYGAFQIMPSNWAPWAKEAGLSPHAPRTRQNQYIVARHKFTEYVTKYGVKGAFAAWYGGPVNGYRYSHGYATDAKGRPWTAKNGNGDEESIQSYVNTQWANYQRNGGVATGGYLTGLGSADLDYYGNDRSQMNHVFTIQDEKPERSWWDRLSDSYMENALDNGGMSAARYLYSFNAVKQNGNDVGIPFINSKYKPTQQDIEYVRNLLPGDAEAQNFVLNSAYSVDHLYMLAAMKKEDADRAQRLAHDESFWDGNIARGIGWVGGNFFDPVTLGVMALSGGAAAPEAMGATKSLSMLRAARNLGTSILKMSPFAESKIARFGLQAAKGAAFMGADRYMSHTFGGFEPNYAANMAVGAVLGGALGNIKTSKKLTGKDFKATKVGKKVMPKLMKVENSVLSLAVGARPDERMLKRVETMRPTMHLDVKGLAKKDPDVHVKLEAMKDVKFLSHREAKKVAAEASVPFSSKTKVFMVPKTGEIVAVGDRIRSPAALDKVRHMADAMRSNYADASEAAKVVPESMESPEAKQMVEELTNSGYSKREANELVSNIVDVEKTKREQLIVYPDGSARVNGVLYEADNPANPVTAANWLRDEAEIMKDMQGGLPWFVPKKLGKSLEDGHVFKTIYGTLANSPSRNVSGIAHRLFADPRMRGKLGEVDHRQIMPAEDIAKRLKDELSIHFDPYYALRKKWINSKGKSITNKHYSQLFDKEMVECYNMKYGEQASKRGLHFDPEVVKAADVTHDAIETALLLGKEDARMHGGNIDIGSFVDKDWNPVDSEFFRRVDNDAVCDFVNRYFNNDRDAAIKELTRYGTVACDLDKLVAKAQRAEDRKYAKLLERYKKGEIKIKPQKVEVSREEVAKTIPDLANKWATGIIDKNQSRFVFVGENGLGEDPVTFMRNRFPMDTGVTLPLHGKDGIPFDFNFDDMLRDTDVHSIMQSYMHRMSGEIAIHDALGSNWRNDSKMLHEAYIDMNKAVDTIGSGLSRSGANDQKRALEEGLSRILGTHMEDKSLMDAVSNLARTKAYSDVGGQMSIAQMGEIGGSMGYAGAHIVLKEIPIVNNIRRAMLSGDEKELEDVARIIRDHTFGQDIQRRIWSSTSSTESREFRDVMSRTSKWAKGLDKVQDFENLMGKVTSTVNQLPHLTDYMVRQGQESGIVDSLKWAKGEKFMLRDPFSKKALKAVGVTGDRQIKNLKDSIIKYLNTDKFDTWRKSDPTNYFRWYSLVNNYSRKTIQQMGVGDTPLLKEQNWFTKMLFQFKDYSFRAVNTQTMRALTSGQLDDCLAATYSMGTNMMGYMALVYLRAWARYPGDEEKRQAYINRNLTWERLAWAAISRGAITGSIPSFGNDIYEALSGNSMFRTTVNNSYNTQKDNSVQGIAGRVVEQMPAVSSGLAPIYSALTSAYHGMKGIFTKEDMRGLMKWIPLNGWLGMTLATSGLDDALDLPTNKEVRQQEKMEEGVEPQQDTSESSNNALSKIMNVR